VGEDEGQEGVVGGGVGVGGEDGEQEGHEVEEGQFD
jgi:hypothetical protein